MTEVAARLSLKNDDTATKILAFMSADRHFFIQITASSTWKFSENQPFICGSPI